jgi:hypothetical protein
LPKIVHQREVKPRIAQLEAQGILPRQIAADRIRCLAIGEPVERLPHHNQCYAPGRDFHGTPGEGGQIGKEVISIEGAELGTALHREGACGERGLHGGHGHLWDRR